MSCGQLHNQVTASVTSGVLTFNFEFVCAVLAARQQLEACLENPNTRQLKEAIDAAEPFKEQLGELWSTAQSGMLL